MGIHFAIHTYGHFEAMFYVINAIKMIMASDFNTAVIKLMALIVTSHNAILGMAGAVEGRVSTYFLKTAGMLIVVNALLTPKADMLVIDRISSKKELVTDLPYGFVLSAGVFEAFGAGITALFEQTTAPVNSTPYKDYGMIFSPRMVQESKNWRIANPEFSRNMDAFLERCVVLESMIGTRFTPEDVKGGRNNLFELATENAGTFRKVDFRMKGVRKHLTCKEAGAELKTYFQHEMGFLSFKYKNSDFAIAGGSGVPIVAEAAALKLNKLLARNLEIGYKNALGIEGKAEDIVRQNMMINAVKDYTNKVDLYSYTRAASIQNSNWFVSGELAKEYLPLLLNIIKALIYASFVFIAPLMILSGGMGKYLKYCMVVFSLQIWPALNSILNLFIELYSHLRGASITGGELTFGNFNQVHQAVDTIVLVASGLQMTIPFLSFAIVKGGVDGFIHLASSVQSASSSAASIAAGEVTSGSRGFDNITKGSTGIDQKSGFKTDWNQSHQEGATQIQGASGDMFRTFADGSSSIMSGGGMNLSSGSRRFNLEESTQSGIQQHLSSTLSSLQGDERSFNQSRNAVISKTGDLVSHIAQREVAGQSFNYEQMGEQGKTLQQAVNHTKMLRDQNGYGWEQAANASVKAYADAGMKTPDAFPLFKASGGVATEAGVSANNNSNQSLSNEEQVSNENHTNKSFNNLMKAAQNQNWMKENNIDNSFAESARASYDKMQSYQESINQKREQADSYSSALQASQNSGASDSRDMYHDVEQGVMKQYGVSQKQAHQMIENNDPRASRVWDGIVNQNMGNAVAQASVGKSYVESIASRDGQKFHNENAYKVNEQGVDDLRERATNQGLNQQSVQAGITKFKEELAAQKHNLTGGNDDQISAVAHHNHIVNRGLQGRADKYEEDRIGQGWFGKKFGVGGVDSAERSLTNLSGQAPQITPLKRGKADENGNNN